jgi:hypothetical protein
MDYFKKIRKVLTNYPPVSKNLRVYLDPEICGIDEDYATSTQSVVTIVDTMDEADIIPVFVSYTDKCEGLILDVVNNYPDKACQASNFVDIVNLELELPNKEDFEAIKLMLMSTDPESFILGLNMLRGYQLDENDKAWIQSIIMNFSPNYNGKGGSIIPLHGQSRIEIENTAIIDFYNMWLMNKFNGNSK